MPRSPECAAATPSAGVRVATAAAARPAAAPLLGRGIRSGPGRAPGTLRTRPVVSHRRRRPGRSTEPRALPENPQRDSKTGMAGRGPVHTLSGNPDDLDPVTASARDGLPSKHGRPGRHPVAGSREDEPHARCASWSLGLLRTTGIHGGPGIGLGIRVLLGGWLGLGGVRYGVGRVRCRSGVGDGGRRIAVALIPGDDGTEAGRDVPAAAGRRKITAREVPRHTRVGEESLGHDHLDGGARRGRGDEKRCERDRCERCADGPASVSGTPPKRSREADSQSFHVETTARKTSRVEIGMAVSPVNAPAVTRRAALGLAPDPGTERPCLVYRWSR